MVILLWDASALAKHYAPEIGSETVDALLASVPSAQQVSTAVSYAEIYSILLRKFNRANIDRMAFEAAKSSLRSEMINDPDFVLLSVDDTAFYSGIALMEAYNINATDAALLFLFQSYITTVPQTNQAKFIIVAADERLIRASEAEGLTAINPESLFAADIPALLANL